MEEIAERSTTVEDFKSELLGFLATCDMRNEAAEEARKQIRLLLQYDGAGYTRTVYGTRCRYGLSGCFMSF